MKVKQKRKIGLFGGTFDPPHNGHLHVACVVQEALQLDEVRFIPTNIPPHKQASSASAEQRLAMLTLVLDGKDFATVDTIELDRVGVSYSIDTVKQLRGQEPDHDFYFMIGGDMIDDLPNWKQFDELLQLVQFVGVRRPNYRGETDLPIQMVEMEEMDISSSEIRHRLKIGQSVSEFLPEKVMAYIKEHSLYGARKSD